MAFIPIDAKADIQGSKKGKITPAQHAQLNAFCFAKKTGILNCLNKCTIKFNTISANDHKAIAIFNSGYIVICGRLIECEDGTTVTIETPAIGSVDGKIILRFDLNASQEEECKIITTTNTELVQDDLNSNMNGVYEFELYSYTATPNQVIITERSKDYYYVPSVHDRLTELGFKSGSLDLTSGKITVNKFTRQGFYIIGDFEGESLGMPTDTIIYNDGLYTATWKIPIREDNGDMTTFCGKEKNVVVLCGGYYSDGANTNSLSDAFSLVSKIQGAYLIIQSVFGTNLPEGVAVMTARINTLKFTIGYEHKDN